MNEPSLNIGKIIALMLLLAGNPLMASDIPPMADVHLHFNIDQMEETDTSDALRILIENNIVFGVVSSKPPALALDLADASGGWIIPFFMPYLEPERKLNWFRDKRVLPATRNALASGRYRGIGEIHIIAGFFPSLNKRHAIVDGMFDLADEFDVPILIHVEASSPLYFQPLCERHPESRIIWAHAGSPLPPLKVGELLRACPNVWVDLSARDHMRYGRVYPIVDDDGLLLPVWGTFFMEFQDRVLTGSDPVYYEGTATWDSADTGWNYVSEVLAFHRHWLDSLSANIQKKIALQNAMRFFRLSEEKDIRMNGMKNRERLERAE